MPKAAVRRRRQAEHEERSDSFLEGGGADNQNIFVTNRFRNIGY